MAFEPNGNMDTSPAPGFGAITNKEHAMKTLPETVAPYKRTPTFTEDTVPAGLLKDHCTKEGVWGKIVIIKGALEYTITEPEKETITLNEHQHGVVEPRIPHHIKPLGPVTFYVEFQR